MLERYEKAASDDLKYIKELLQKDPQAKNAQCPLENERLLRTGAVFAGKTVGWASLALVGAAIVTGPAGWLFIAGEAAGLAYSFYNTTKSIRSRINWTLLDYAAESGAINVAMYLIFQGADTTDKHFLTLAKANGHDTLYKICRMAIVVMKMWDDAKKKIKLLNDEIDTFKNESEKYKNECDGIITALEDQKAALQNEVKKHIDEISELTDDNADWKKLCSTLLGTEEDSLGKDADSPPKPAQTDKPAAAEKTSAKSASTCTKGMFNPAPFIYAYGLQEDRVRYKAGDCFYDAVVAFRKDRKWSKDALRASVCKELEENQENYLPFMCQTDDKKIKIETEYNIKTKKSTFVTVQGYKAYCELMRKPRKYIDHTELNAFINTEKVCCVILDKLNGTKIVEGREYISDKNPPIFLGRENNNHYYPLKCPTGKNWQSVMREVDKDTAFKPGMKSK